MTISTSFSAKGVGSPLPMDKQQTLGYAVTGTFVGTVLLEHSFTSGQSWEDADRTITTTASGEIAVRRDAWYRFRCTAYTSGTIVAAIDDSTVDTVASVNNLAGTSVFGITDDGITTPKITLNGKYRTSWNPRVVALTDAATVTPNADTTDVGVLSSVSQGITIANPTGTPEDRQLLQIDLISASTQTIAYGNKFRASADVALVTDTTGTAKLDSLLFRWHDSAQKWTATAKNMGA